ncbi:MAG: exopolysaccharide biosynthesis polyprenyl glycosylphosphotransferase, partial [Gaiellaceae bacterium]
IYTSVDVTVAVVGWAVVISVAVVLRSLARVTWRRTLPKERVVIVGDGRLAQVTERKLAFFAEAHQSVVASIRPAELDERIVEVPFFDRIVVACQAIDDELIRRLVRFCRENDVKLSVIPPARALAGTAAQLSRIGDLPVVEYNTWDVSRSTLALKRALDIVLAAAALVLLAPVMAVCALAIFIDDGRPVLFVQARAGLGGMAFRMLKFRTMVVDAEARLPELVALDRLPAPVFKLRSDPRVTTVGRFLRRFSLDELPQLVNVLRGQMSLVGPRPEQLELADRYTPEQRLRLALRPGMTGPMQVSGRGELGLEERLMVERAYIENLSLRRDLQILASTLPAVLVGRGAF